MAAYEKYTLMVGEEAAERLRILNLVCNPFTLKFLTQLESFHGKKILDIGCGTGIMSCELAKLAGTEGSVTAVDISSEQLEIAKKTALENQCHNIAFKELAADNIDNLNEQYDVVYCRFLLVHLTNPEVVLQKALALLNKGGLLICEEPVGYESMFAYPETKIFDQWKKIAFEQINAHNTDFSFGKKFFNWAHQYHLQNVQLQLTQPLLRTEEEKYLLWLGVHELAPVLIKAGLATDGELKKIIEDLKDFARDTDFLVGFVPYMQMAGYKP